MNYEQSLSYLSALPGRVHSGAPGEDCLAPLHTLLGQLGNPQEQLKFIHVVGTNGKGSTCAILASALSTAGFSVGLYTSPYIVELRERVQLGGRMIPRGTLSRLVTRLRPRAQRLAAAGTPLTQFEFLTALALVWYREENCDLVVLEAGLGGRLDATNVIPAPLAAVLCPMGYDHTEILGPTLAQIAWEKCGILKAGCPVVCAPGQPPEAMEVIRRRCAQEGCRLVLPDPARLEAASCTLSGSRFSYCGMPLELSLLGPHQLQNCITAVETLAVLALAGWAIPPQALAEGVRRAFLPGRLEILCRRPLILLDGAHNPHGVAALLESITALGLRRVTAVVGMLGDKEVAGSMDIIAPFLRRIIATRPPSPRAMAPGELAALLARCCPDVTAEEDPHRALALARQDPGDAIVIFGSLFLVAALREDGQN